MSLVKGDESIRRPEVGVERNWTSAFQPRDKRVRSVLYTEGGYVGDYLPRSRDDIRPPAALDDNNYRLHISITDLTPSHSPSNPRPKKKINNTKKKCAPKPFPSPSQPSSSPSSQPQPQHPPRQNSQQSTNTRTEPGSKTSRQPATAAS